MRRLKSITWGFAILLAGCGGAAGGSGGSGGSGGGSAVTPTPTPAPTVTPTPAPSPTPSVTLTYLHSLKDILPGGARAAGLIPASDGNFYGVSQSGPNSCRPVLAIPCGSVIKVTPDGTQSVFYAFGTIANDGYMPRSLIQGVDGALYGVTTNGGKFDGGGTVFKLTLGGAYTSLYSFGTNSSDGLVPTGLIQASDGNFYGTTASGGANHCDAIPQEGPNCGAVFKLTPEGVGTTLHSFGASASDGIEPEGSLIEGSDGNLYGMTSIGGANTCGSADHSCGTVFAITRSGTLTILHSFGASAGDGIAPSGTLVKGNDGAFYGRTSSGGGGRCGWPFGCGTIFRITMAGETSIVHAFSPDSRADGDGPAALIVGRDGNFYGTTISGGSYQCDSCGTVFKLTPSGTITTLYSFGPVNTNPARPITLTEAGDGTLYGMNEWDVLLSGNQWTFFRLVGK